MNSLAGVFSQMVRTLLEVVVLHDDDDSDDDDDNFDDDENINCCEESIGAHIQRCL